MSILGFITGSNPQRVIIKRDGSEGPQLPGLTLDAAMNINPQHNGTPTKNPVESGGNIADHVTLDNLKFGIEGFVAEAPLPFSASEQALGALAGIAGGAVGTGVGGGIAAQAAVALVSSTFTRIANFALSPDVGTPESLEQQIANRNLSDTDFPRKAYEYLWSLHQARSLIQVITQRKTYTNLVLTQLSAPQTIENGRSLKFTAMFEQLKIVNSASVSIPENKIAADAVGASSKANLGKQATSGTTSAQDGVVQSKLSQLTGIGG